MKDCVDWISASQEKVSQPQKLRNKTVLHFITTTHNVVLEIETRLAKKVNKKVDKPILETRNAKYVCINAWFIHSPTKPYKIDIVQKTYK